MEEHMGDRIRYKHMHWLNAGVVMSPDRILNLLVLIKRLGCDGNIMIVIFKIV